jgi:hypothetical protein
MVEQHRRNHHFGKKQIIGIQCEGIVLDPQGRKNRLVA